MNSIESRIRKLEASAPSTATVPTWAIELVRDKYSGPLAQMVAQVMDEPVAPPAEEEIIRQAQGLAGKYPDIKAYQIGEPRKPLSHEIQAMLDEAYPETASLR